MDDQNLDSNLQENQINNVDKSIQKNVIEIKSQIEEKERKKRGRKPKSEAKEIPQTVNPQLVAMSQEQYENALKGLFTVSGLYLAKATKFDGFLMNEEELKAVCSQGGMVMQTFMPTIDQKWLVLGGFTFTVAGIYGMKVMAYNEWVKVQKKPTDDGVKKD